jgi:acetyltransferase-like isoleucine patch superfamily enzyme
MTEYACITPDVKLGQGVKLSKFINLYGCEIGDNTKIGAFVEIGHGVTFVNDSYPRATASGGQLQTEKDWKVEQTLVKKGASIGSGSTILSKVVIGENAIIGAGSVVTKDVPANAIVAGNPAKVLRTIPEELRTAK